MDRRKMREDIEFPAEDGAALRGWFYSPEGAAEPWPLARC